MNKYERLDLIIREINKGVYPSIHDLCRLCEKAERTIYDDIAYLRNLMELDIKFDDVRGGYFNADPSRKLPQFNLSAGEAFAITIGKDMLAEYSGTMFEPILKSAIDKIEERLPEKIRADLPTLVSAIRFKASGVVASIDRTTFFALNQACEEQHVVQLQYAAAKTGQTTFREVEPLIVLENRGAWYLIAWCRMRNDIRMFALQRIVSYKILDETFTERADIDVNNYLKDAFLLEHGDPAQTYRIKFNQSAARYVRERKWHSSQEIVNTPDDGCILSFSATSMDEVKRWVLGYGADAEVLEPKKLRTMMLEEFRKSVEAYGAPVVAMPKSKSKQVAAQKSKDNSASSPETI